MKNHRGRFREKLAVTSVADASGPGSSLAGRGDLGQPHDPGNGLDERRETRTLDRNPVDGQPAWVLVHVEVQGEPESAFAERRFVYSHRIRNAHAVPVASLAVLEAAFRDDLYRLRGEQTDAVRDHRRAGRDREGLQQGEQIGDRKGEPDLLLWQIAKKFGADAIDSVRQRIEAADNEVLRRWSERILTADTLEAIFHRAMRRRSEPGPDRPRQIARCLGTPAFFVVRPRFCF